jgi:AmmeMemoRadiSam system protein A
MKESVIQQSFSLSEKKLMLRLARETLTHYLSTGKTLEYDETNLPDSLLDVLGVFVSLHKGRALRGCIGRMKTERPLYKNIQREVISAATIDSRFTPVKYSELLQLCIEISVLGPMIKIDTIDEIELGKHGIYIKQGNASGTFLPQVAKSTGWTLEEFLGYCSKDKVGIGWEGWKNADLYIYTAEVFSEKNC